MSMRIWSFLLIPAFAGLALGQSKPPHAQAPSKQAAVPLQLSVRIDRQTYRMSDSMKMETQITNIGNDDVYLYDWNLCWNFARWLKMMVFDSKGAYVHTHFLVDCVPPPPRPGDVYQFIKLEPGRFYGIADESPIRDMVNEPGEYDLDVSYESCMPAELVSEFFSHDPISKLPLWTMEKPILKANRVHFRVVP